MRKPSRARRALLACATVLAVAPAARAAWPVPSSHDVLHSFGTPHRRGEFELHAGIDILGYNLEVFAARAGKVILPLGTTECGRVSVRTASGAIDLYDHVQPVVGNNAQVAAGALLGNISINCSEHGTLRHVHWQVTTSTGTGELANPLSLLSAGQSDPQNQAAEIRDVDGDGNLLRAVKHPLPQTAGGAARLSTGLVVWGSVDLIVDASDDMSSAVNVNVAPYQLSYWIEALDGGVDVASQSEPYQVFCFGSQTLDAVALAAVCPDTTCSRLDEPIGTPWDRLLSWRITSATRQRVPNQTCESWLPPTDASGYWKTKAKAGTRCKPNGMPGGTGTGPACTGNASSNATSRFPDGEYRLHADARDLTHAANPWHEDLLVDNWAPFVTKVTAGRLGTEVSLYEVSTSATARLVGRTTPGSERGALVAPGQTALQVRATFSEQVESPLLAIGAGNQPRLSASRQLADKRTWVWDLDAAVVTAATQIRIWAVDLAGSRLVPISARGRQPPPSPHPPPNSTPRPQIIRL